MYRQLGPTMLSTARHHFEYLQQKFVQAVEDTSSSAGTSKKLEALKRLDDVAHLIISLE
jgi:hypothetical protein